MPVPCFLNQLVLPTHIPCLLQVVAAAGGLHFSAAVTTSGLLYTWRWKGTPLLSPLALGCPPVSMSVQGDWQLLIVGADGSMLTLDLSQVGVEGRGHTSLCCALLVMTGSC